jgi:hypothetical protein
VSHIDRVVRALEVAGFGVNVYVDNDHVFGFDITLTLDDSVENVGHAVFSPSRRKSRPEMLFVEGRLYRETFAAVGRTPARTLFEFERYVTEKVLA